MPPTSRDELRRQRLREYDAALTEARSSVAVLIQFVRGREARGDGLLEEAFAATSVDGVEDADLFPAAVWVTLRQGDIDATVELLVRLSKKDFLVGEHEQLDAAYRLMTVEEQRAVPDVELLQQQVAGLLHIPCNVIGVVASWGADDPRTAAEVESLLEQRFGPPVAEPAVPRLAPWEDETPHVLVSARANSDPIAGLLLSSAEFIALLHLTPEQGAILKTVVRQADITIGRQLFNR